MYRKSNTSDELHDCGCFVRGKLLTENGYVDIRNIRVGDKLVDGLTRELIPVIGISSNIIGNRRVLIIKNSIVTEDHVLLVDNVPVVPHYNSLKKTILRDVERKVEGMYKVPQNVEEMKNVTLHPIDPLTKTYSPICEKSFYGVFDESLALIASKLG